MRVLVYGDIGGSGGYVRYCKGLFGSGVWPKAIETTFCCSTGFAAELGDLDSDIRVVHHAWPASNNRFHRYLWHLWLYPHLVRHYRPDLEFFPSGNLRDFLRHPCSVTTCHNLLPFVEREINRYVGQERTYWLSHRQRQGQMFERSSGVIFLSNHSQDVVMKEFPRIRGAKVISHGIDDGFRRTTPRSYRLSDQVRVVYVSPVYHYKHQYEVIQALDILRNRTGLDIQLWLVGGGAQAEITALQKVIGECRGERFCHHLPFLSSDDVRQALHDADLFVFASSCETFGMALVEAMASRLPIACSNRSGLRDILRDAGVWFDPEKPESIAEALRQLIADPVLRRTCGERAYHYSQEYSWKRCACETAAFLKQTAGQK